MKRAEADDGGDQHHPEHRVVVAEPVDDEREEIFERLVEVQKDENDNEGHVADKRPKQPPPRH